MFETQAADVPPPEAQISAAVQSAPPEMRAGAAVPVAPGEQSPAPYLWWTTRRGWLEVAGEYAKLVYYHAHY